MIKKSRVLVNLNDVNGGDGSKLEVGPVWNENYPDRVYITMRWEEGIGEERKEKFISIALNIEELKNAIRLIEDAKYE